MNTIGKYVYSVSLWRTSVFAGATRYLGIETTLNHLPYRNHGIERDRQAANIWVTTPVFERWHLLSLRSNTLFRKFAPFLHLEP